jgi:hypothetical protein
MNRMALACLASIGIFAGGLAAWSAIRQYKSRGPRKKKQVKTVVEEEPKEILAEQLA